MIRVYEESKVDATYRFINSPEGIELEHKLKDKFFQKIKEMFNLSDEELKEVIQQQDEHLKVRSLK